MNETFRLSRLVSVALAELVGDEARTVHVDVDIESNPWGLRDVLFVVSCGARPSKTFLVSVDERRDLETAVPRVVRAMLPWIERELGDDYVQGVCFTSFMSR